MDAGLPGVSGPGADGMRLQFVGMMMGVVRGELESWGAAVRRQDSRPLAEHYNPDASIVQPGAAFLKGNQAMHAFSEGVTGRANDANASMLDVEVSDGIAHIYGAYHFQPLVAGTPTSSGRHVTVLRRYGADWRIRTQFFDPGASAQPFPGVPAGTEPFMLELGTTDSGQVPRDAFIGAVTGLAGMRRAWQENDASAVRRFFTRDALLLLPGDEAPARGAAVDDAIRVAVTAFASFDTLELDFTSSGRLAVLVGEYVLERRNGRDDGVGHYVALLAKDGRDWKIRSLVLD
jgi:ketosteroid isomerase-like protein